MKNRTLSVLALTLLGVVSACGEQSPNTPRPSGAASQGNHSVAAVAISDDALASLNFAQALRDAGSRGATAPLCSDLLKNGHRAVRTIDGELGDRTRYAVRVGFRPDGGAPTYTVINRTLADGRQVNARLSGDSVNVFETAPRAQGGGAAQHWAGSDSPVTRAVLAVRDAAAQLPACTGVATATAVPKQS
jgi:hypothetical protein